MKTTYHRAGSFTLLHIKSSALGVNNVGRILHSIMVFPWEP